MGWLAKIKEPHLPFGCFERPPKPPGWDERQGPRYSGYQPQDDGRDHSDAIPPVGHATIYHPPKVVEVNVPSLPQRKTSLQVMIEIARQTPNVVLRHGGTTVISSEYGLQINITDFADIPKLFE